MTQPLVGGRIEFYEENMDLCNALKRAAAQSVVNCGKHVLGGGFNPRRKEEIEEVYGS